MLPLSFRWRREYALLQRLVAPLREDAVDAAVASDAAAAVAAHPEDALGLLVRHGLGPLFLGAMEKHDLVGALPSDQARALLTQRRAALAAQLYKEKALRLATEALGRAACPFAVIKGHHLAEIVYDRPHDRLHADIDLVVDPSRRLEAITALAGVGFTPVIALENLSHEVVLRGHDVELDLHWELFRPGRARGSLAAGLIRDADRGGVSPIPNAAWSLVFLLVHPALTEYVTGRLIHAVDLARWIARQPCPWADVVEIVGQARLKTAAWAMLRWTRAWFDAPVPVAVERALRPNAARRAYIHGWLAADPSHRYARHRLAVRAGFSLALQDGPVDVVRALAARRGARCDAARLARAVRHAAAQAVSRPPPSP
jgi:hypothetical protein